MQADHAPNRRCRRFVAVCLGAILAGLGTTAPDASPIGDPDRGRVLYDQHCVACHGPTGRGDGQEATFLSPRPASLISAATSAKSDKELLQTIADGKPHTAMRGWSGTLSPEEQRHVLAYLRSLVRFIPTLPASPPSATSR